MDIRDVHGLERRLGAIDAAIVRLSGLSPENILANNLAPAGAETDPNAPTKEDIEALKTYIEGSVMPAVGTALRELQEAKQEVLRVFGESDQLAQDVAELKSQFAELKASLPPPVQPVPEGDEQNDSEQQTGS